MPGNMSSICFRAVAFLLLQQVPIILSRGMVDFDPESAELSRQLQKTQKQQLETMNEMTASAWKSGSLAASAVLEPLGSSPMEVDWIDFTKPSNTETKQRAAGTLTKISDLFRTAQKSVVTDTTSNVADDYSVTDEDTDDHLEMPQAQLPPPVSPVDPNLQATAALVYAVYRGTEGQKNSSFTRDASLSKVINIMEHSSTNTADVKHDVKEGPVNMLVQDDAAQDNVVDQDLGELPKQKPTHLASTSEGAEVLNLVGIPTLKNMAVSKMSPSFVQALRLLRPNPGVNAMLLRISKYFDPLVTMVQLPLIVLHAAMNYQHPTCVALQNQWVTGKMFASALKAKLYVYEDDDLMELEDVEIYREWVKENHPKLEFFNNLWDLRLQEALWKRTTLGIMPINRLSLYKDLMKMEILRLNQRVIGPMRKIYIEHVKDKAETAEDKVARDLILKQFDLLDRYQKLAAIKTAFDLHFRKFQWDVIIPQMYRKFLLKARWLIATNRKYIYIIHQFLLSTKGSNELHAYPSADIKPSMSLYPWTHNHPQWNVWVPGKRGPVNFKYSDVHPYAKRHEQLTLSEKLEDDIMGGPKITELKLTNSAWSPQHAGTEHFSVTGVHGYDNPELKEKKPDDTPVFNSPGGWGQQVSGVLIGEANPKIPATALPSPLPSKANFVGLEKDLAKDAFHLSLMGQPGSNVHTEHLTRLQRERRHRALEEEEYSSQKSHQETTDTFQLNPTAQLPHFPQQQFAPLLNYNKPFKHEEVLSLDNLGTARKHKVHHHAHKPADFDFKFLQTEESHIPPPGPETHTTMPSFAAKGSPTQKETSLQEYMASLMKDSLGPLASKTGNALHLAALEKQKPGEYFGWKQHDTLPPVAPVGIHAPRGDGPQPNMAESSFNLAWTSGGGYNSPPFAMMGYQVKQGSWLMGIDDLSFNPETSGNGPPPAQMATTLEEASKQRELVSAAAQRAWLAYLDFGLRPLNHVEVIGYFNLQMRVFMMDLWISWNVIELYKHEKAFAETRYQEAFVYDDVIELASENVQCYIMLKVLHMAHMWVKWLLERRLRMLYTVEMDMTLALTSLDEAKVAQFSRTFWFFLTPSWCWLVNYKTSLENVIDLVTSHRIEIARRVWNWAFKTFKRKRYVGIVIQDLHDLDAGEVDSGMGMGGDD